MKLCSSFQKMNKKKKKKPEARNSLETNREALCEKLTPSDSTLGEEQLCGSQFICHTSRTKRRTQNRNRKLDLPSNNEGILDSTQLLALTCLQLSS
jgi:hypothetical protein